MTKRWRRWLRRALESCLGPGAVSSWVGAMICGERAARRLVVQLHLDLTETPAPAAALWELVGEQQRRAAMALLAALIAHSVADVQDEDEDEEIAEIAEIADGE